MEVELPPKTDTIICNCTRKFNVSDTRTFKNHFLNCSMAQSDFFPIQIHIKEIFDSIQSLSELLKLKIVVSRILAEKYQQIQQKIDLNPHWDSFFSSDLELATPCPNTIEGIFFLIIKRKKLFMKIYLTKK